MSWFQDSVNQIALIGALFIVLITVYVVGFYLKKMKDARAEGELTHEEWDGIKEYKNDVPIGWMLCFIGLIIWGIWYMLVGYPLNSFSQIGQYNDEKKAYNERFEAQWSGLSEDDKIAMGEGIFLVQCSQCHGLNAEGIDGRAQNLRRWGTEEGIMYTVENGSKGLDYEGVEMTAGLVDDPEQIRQVAAYIMQTFSAKKKTKYPISDVEAGAKVYHDLCAICHGEDGKGNGYETIGFAPDLTAYGSHIFVKKVLQHGKKGNIGQMPSFKYANFNDVQIEALSVYIHSLKLEE